MYSSSPYTLCIILAVYNGQDFIEQQLDSICSQKHQGWDLRIRDDASSDASLSIVESFAKENSHVYLIENSEGNLGATKSFVCLLESKQLESYSYVAFSDQDDIWAQDKLSRQVEEMQKLKKNNPNTPLLIHSDMQVVDANLQQIHPSFMIYQGIRHEPQNPLHVLLAQNFVTGCTMMVNRSLLEFALPIPKEALLHDWWLALCSAVCGEIAYIDQPLVKYRQHGNNEVGAKHISNLINPCKNNWYKHWKSGQDNLAKSMRQAEALAQRIKERDPDNIHLQLIEHYASLLELSPLKRIIKLKKLNIHAQSTLRHSLLLARLASLPKV